MGNHVHQRTLVGTHGYHQLLDLDLERPDDAPGEVHLRVRRSNEAAIRAYRSQGFTMAGDVEGDATGCPPEVAMVRRL